MTAMCARVQTGSNQVWTNGLNAEEIIGNEHMNLITIYSPCADDNQFFDGWGG